MKENEDISVLAEISSMYYEQFLPQNEIAKRTFFSKSKVSRMLKKAREIGVVEVNIKYPIEQVTSLEEKLISLYQLKKCIVIKDYPEHHNSETRLKRLAKAATIHLEEIVQDGSTIGLSWGKTLSHLVNELPPQVKKDVSIVQLMGTASDLYDDDNNTTNLVRKVADKYKGNAVILYAPLFVESQVVKKILLKEKIIQKALMQAKNVDIAVTGIADFTSENTSISWSGYLSEKRKTELIKRGAVGFICGHLIDKNGACILTEEENNSIGISLGDLRNIPHVIAISGGRSKLKATYASLMSRTIDCLVTDVQLAQELVNKRMQTKQNDLKK